MLTSILRFPPIERLTATLVLTTAVLVTTGCDQPTIEDPNVLIIVLDTVRQDRLSSYGYPRPTSPHFDRLADESTVFANAYSTTSWTAPAHASLFTGLFPASHGVTQERWHMGEDLVTIAEVFRDDGYHTFGLVENASLSKHNGFTQGFTDYVPLWRQRRKRKLSGAAEAKPPGTETVEAFERTIDALDASRPFFGFVNLVGAHSEYQSSDSHKALFVTDPSIPLKGNHWHSYYRGQTEFTAEEVRHLNEIYDASILAVDETVAGMLEHLRVRDLLDETVLVITSDHGENLGDHDHFGHVFSLYNSTFEIPLLIRFPGAVEAGAVRNEPVQLTDVAPTVLALASVDSTALGPQGRDLFGPDLDRRRLVVGEYYKPRQAVRAMSRGTQDDVWKTISEFDRHLRTIIDRDLKLIWASDGRSELYDLAADPLETTNLIDDPAYAEERARLEQLLERFIEASTKRGVDDQEWTDKPPDDETREALKALGYLQ